MIRIIILLSCVALSFLCEAQNLRWGNEFNSNLRSPTLGQLLAGSINNKVYVIENAVKTGQANTTEKDMITSLKIFDGATKFLKEVSLSDILAKQIKAIPEKIYVAEALVWKNTIRVIFTAEQDKRAHPLFYVQHLSENGELINKPISLTTVKEEDHKFDGYLGVYRSVAYSAASKFTYAISPDSSKFVQMEVFNDLDYKKKSIYLHTYDENFRLLSTNQMQLEGPGGYTSFSNFKINNRGDLYLVTQTQKSSEELKQHKFQHPYSYGVYVSSFGSGKGVFKPKTLSLPGNQYVTSASIFIDENDEIRVTGSYSNADDKERGRYHAGYYCGNFSGYTPTITLKGFTTPNVFFDQLHSTQKKDLRIAAIHLSKIFYPPIPKKVIPVPGKGYYVIAEVETRDVAHGYYEQELFSGDMLIYFINNNNEILWFRHIPKRQEFNAAGYGFCNMDNMLGFQTILDSDNRLNLVYHDRKENEIPDAVIVEKPVVKIRVDRNENNVEGLAHAQYDPAGILTKRTFYRWPPEHEKKLFSSAAIAFANNKAVFLTFQLGKQRRANGANSDYCLAEFAP